MHVCTRTKFQIEIDFLIQNYLEFVEVLQAEVLLIRIQSEIILRYN